MLKASPLVGAAQRGEIVHGVSLQIQVSAAYVYLCVFVEYYHIV